MVLNFKTLEHEIAAVKNYGEKNHDLINIDGELQYTVSLLHPITDAKDKAVYTELK